MTITANCQNDTLSKSQLDSLVSWVGAINTDLHDYDLVKQKSYLQGEQIKGLKLIEQKQTAISLRKEFKLSSFSSQIIDLQNQNFALQNKLYATKRKSFIRGVGNVFFIGTTLFLTGKLINLY